MKTLLTTFICLALLAGCTKDTTEPETQKPLKTTSTDESTLCFMMNETQECFSGECLFIPPALPYPSRYRIQAYKAGTSIEMEIYAPQVGSFKILDKDYHIEGEATFLFYSVHTRQNLVGLTGTIEITNIDKAAGTISGNFNVKTVDTNQDEKLGNISEGKFVNVPIR